MRANPAREAFPAEMENDHAQDAPETFDETTPVGTPEENRDDTGQAQELFGDNATQVGTLEENQDDAGQAQVPFDDNATPVGTPEEIQDDVGQAQDGGDMDDAASDSSGLLGLVDSTSEDEDEKGARGRNIWPDDSSGEEEEIDQLIFGDIPREDDDPSSFVRHPDEGDMDALYSRDFVDSTTEVVSVRQTFGNS
jgi:hypothetical protein